MSLVYITHHNENIFDADKKINYHESRSGPRYNSKFKKMVRNQTKEPHVIRLEDGKQLLTSSKKYEHKTMGYAETPLDPPCAFLRKHSGVKWQRFNDHVCIKGAPVPPVPRYVREKVDKPEKKVPVQQVHHGNANCYQQQYFKNHKHRANFIAVNIEKMKSAKAVRPPPRYIDTPLGTRHTLLNTGLIPQYICNKNFGKVPCYIKIHKKMLQRYREECETYQKNEQKKCMSYVQEGLRPMTTEERQQILAGLKSNFAELGKAYQSLSLYSDTIAKKLRKGKIENDLRQLEQDIYLIESNPQILVSEY